MEKGRFLGIKVKEYEEWFTKNDKLFASELAIIKELLPPVGRGIEIGVGIGIFAHALGIDYGIEPSEDMAALALKRGIKAIKAKAEDIPLKDGSFQFALMVTVDCFLEDIAKAFREIHRILVKDGIFIIAFLDKDTPLGQEYEKNKPKSRSYKNAKFHTAEEIEKYLKNADYKILARKQTIFTLENKYQESKDGCGQGVFAVIKAICA